MLISKDKKILFIAVPKTGSSSATTVLRKYGDFLIDHRTYLTYKECCDLLENPGRIQKVYIFYRDPVKRFISQINFLRNVQKNTYLIRQRPEWFINIDFSQYLEPYNDYNSSEQAGPRPARYTIKKFMHRSFMAEVQQAANLITPEQIFNDIDSFKFKPQSTWHKDIPKHLLHVLDFSNFAANLQRVAVDFGAISGLINIPRINDGDKITTELSSQLELAVRQHYSDDYALVQNLYHPFS